MPTQRQMRVARRLKAEIARVLLREIEDPLIRFVTITDVAVSPDLKHARVFFSVLGEGEDDPPAALRGLRRARKFIQHRLAEDAELRFTPTLDFRCDVTAQRAQRIEEILHGLADEGGLRHDESEEHSDEADGESDAEDDE